MKLHRNPLEGNVRELVSLYLQYFQFGQSTERLLIQTCDLIVIDL